MIPPKSKNMKECEDCPVKYKFIYDSGKIKLDKFNELHNHLLTFQMKTLTSQIIEDIKTFNKLSKVLDIKETLEVKYNSKLDYYSVYRELRKLFPRFGKDDARNIITILKDKNKHHESEIDLESGQVKKLFFATPRMIQQYTQCGEINLIDSTYRVNHYNIPLIIYAGINSAVMNIIFGVSIVNDEAEETHRWCLEKYFNLYKDYPRIIVKNQDLALSEEINSKYNRQYVIY